jgi:hypothetical protein
LTARRKKNIQKFEVNRTNFFASRQQARETDARCTAPRGMEVTCGIRTVLGGSLFDRNIRSKCSSFVLNAIDNMQILHKCKDSGDAHFANRSNRRRAGVFSEIARSAAAGDDMFNEGDETTLLDHLELIERSHSNDVNEINSHVLDSITAAEVSGMFSYSQQNPNQRGTEPNRHQL